MGGGSHGALERRGSGLENASHRRERTPTDQGKGHVLTGPPPPPALVQKGGLRQPCWGLWHAGPALPGSCSPTLMEEPGCPQLLWEAAAVSGAILPSQPPGPPHAARPGDAGPQRTPSFPVCFSLTLAQASRGFWEPRPLPGQEG